MRTSRSSEDEQAFCNQHQIVLMVRGRAKPSVITEETREWALAFKRNRRLVASCDPWLFPGSVAPWPWCGPPRTLWSVLVVQPQGGFTVNRPAARGR